MTMKRVILVTGVCLLFVSPFANAATVTTYAGDPGGDFQGSSYWADFNTLQCGLGDYGGQRSEGYVKFSIPVLEPPAGMTTDINSATFYWFCGSFNAIDPNMQATLYKIGNLACPHALDRIRPGIRWNHLHG